MQVGCYFLFRFKVEDKSGTSVVEMMSDDGVSESVSQSVNTIVSRMMGLLKLQRQYRRADSTGIHRAGRPSIPYAQLQQLVC